MKFVFILVVLILAFSGCESKDNATSQSSVSGNYDLATVMASIGKEPMVLEIGASTCQACVEMKALIDDMKSADETLPIHIVDVNKDRFAVGFFKIQMIPTQVVFNAKGEEVSRHIGALSREELLKLVELANSK
jgi:thioredoxin 1